MCVNSLNDLYQLDIFVSCWTQGFNPNLLPVLYERIQDKVEHDFTLDQTTNQNMLAQIITKIVSYQQQVLFGDELPQSTMNELAQRCKQALYVCPLVNLESIVILYSVVNQIQLLQICIKSLKLLKSSSKYSLSSDLLRGRAILIVCYTAANLPQAGLASFIKNTNVDIIS